MILAMRGYVFRRKEGRLQLMLNSTMEALNVLEEVRQYLTGFEVIQGTMDDVFLNAIKEENHE